MARYKTLYKCYSCLATFEYPTRNSYFSDEYGDGSTLHCPECGNEEFDEGLECSCGGWMEGWEDKCEVCRNYEESFKAIRSRYGIR